MFHLPIYLFYDGARLKLPWSLGPSLEAAVVLAVYLYIVRFVGSLFHGRLKKAWNKVFKHVDCQVGK